MKRVPIPKAILCLLLLSSPAAAELCAVDVVPAATLLLPYFEVDLDNPQGTNTIVTIHNARAEPTLAKVTFWTDYSIPSIWFDVFLTGYDVVRFDLGDTFHNGNIPITADEQSDPGDELSPGGHPSWDGSFPDCDLIFPFYNNPVLGAFHLERIRSGHTGQGISSLNNECIGSNQGDNVARGYITIDHTRQCQLIGPHETGYFGGNDPVASNENALWGEFSLYQPDGSFGITESLVHIEADPQFDSSSTPTGYTFYGRYTQNEGGNDNREPLGTVWGARYINGPVFTDGTDYLVWRDATSSITPVSIACESTPDWFPLNERAITCWNEQEDVVSLCGPENENDPACFPLETQRVAVGAGDLNPPWTSGWCSLDLNVPGDSFVGDVDFPNAESDVTQSYVMSMSSRSGFYGVGLGAMGMAHACNDISTPFDAGGFAHE